MVIKKKERFLKKIVGPTHIIADFYYPRFIESPRKLKEILYRAAQLAYNTPLKCCIYKFPVTGITAVLVLAESHLAIHTWPEEQYMAIDFLTCGQKSSPFRALEYLKKVFKPKKTKVYCFQRGNLKKRR
ncbi:MAG TPA: adenosylmethionine decarboxylase [Candidatus Omnitrophota bacterium]|nr:adenosylmethionine decarboxylase [Candidatus Omnitrophota bacterium]